MSKSWKTQLLLYICPMICHGRKNFLDFQYSIISQSPVVIVNFRYGSQIWGGEGGGQKARGKSVKITPFWHATNTRAIHVAICSGGEYKFEIQNRKKSCWTMHTDWSVVRGKGKAFFLLPLFARWQNLELKRQHHNICVNLKQFGVLRDIVL